MPVLIDTPNLHLESRLISSGVQHAQREEVTWFSQAEQPSWLDYNLALHHRSIDENPNALVKT